MLCIVHFDLSPRRSGQNTSIRTFGIGRVVCDLSDRRSRLSARVTRALEHTSVRWRDKCLNDITERVAHVRYRLSLDDLLVYANQSFDKPTVLGKRIVERVGNVDVAQIWLNRCVGGSELQIYHDAVDEIDCAVDKTIIPDLGLPHLNGDGGNLIPDKGGLDRAGFTRVNLQGVRLEELRHALDVGKAPVCVTPE
jgi:hypothetical protein